jgi:branched-chain amino acid transport system permease protein
MSQTSSPTSTSSTPATAVSPTEAAPRRLLGSARSRFLLIAGVLALAVVFLIAGDSWLTVLDTMMIYAIAALGLNVLSGYAGQISLGTAFFMGIGAYTAAWLGGSPPQFPGDPAGLSLPFVIWLPAAGIVAALIGALIGPAALRLKGFYLGIVTLSLVFIGQYLFFNLRTIAGPPQGRAVPSPGFGDFTFSSPNPIFGFQFSTYQLWFVLLVVLLGLSGLFVANIARTRAGRAWQAARDNETAASIMGVNLLTAKMGAFVLSSFLAGIAGACYASIIEYTDPHTWSGALGLGLSIQLVAAILIGGAASVWGSILGAAFVFALPSILTNLSSSSSTSTSTGSLLVNNLNTIIYGLLIIVFLLFEPAGLIGLIRRIQLLVRRREAQRKGGDPAHTLAVPATDSPLEIEVTRLPHGST